MKEMDPEDEQVQLQVRKLQDYITDHFYTCSDKILCGLGRMYAGGGELTENIDDVGGVGTAEFTSVYHLINEDMLKQCHKELDGSKAVGIDKVTKDEYGKNLDRNIKDLVQRQIGRAHV